MVENELPAVTPAELVDAFVHPPEIVAVGHRGETESGEVLVVSHLELWLWRVVVRCLRAHRVPPANHGPSLEAVPDANGSGVAVMRVVMAGPEETELRRSQTAWLQQWQLTDDIGTSYRMSRAGSSGGHERAMRTSSAGAATGRGRSRHHARLDVFSDGAGQRAPSRKAATWRSELGLTGERREGSEPSGWLGEAPRAHGTSSRATRQSPATPLGVGPAG